MEFNLSIVVCTRNDNHGGYLTERSNNFLNYLAYKLKKFSITDTELIIVEWNQIKNNKPLKDLLDFEKIKKETSVKILTVNEDLHNKFKNSNKLHFYQMIAKNVGIRNASGKFVLCTNIDVIFNDNFFLFLKQNKLQEKTLYRLARHDLNIPYTNGILTDDDLDKKVGFINDKNFTYDTMKKRRYYVTSSPYRFYYYLIYSIQDYGYLTTIIKTLNKIKNIQKKTIFFYIKNFFRILFAKLFTKKLFTNACGDFTLLDKKSWQELNGYDESPIYSWHLDSIFLWKARFNKLNFYNFQKSIYCYHLSHGFGGSQPDREEMFKKLKRDQIPYLKNSDLISIIEQYKKDPQYSLVNQTNWGLKDDNISIEKII